jgi:NADPH:quinone reductase-like Zn-dependent oxidoreductase
VKAVIYSNYGLPDQLQIMEVDMPVLRDDEVLVKIFASSINSWDWDLLRGTPFLVRIIGGLIKPRNKILGADIAGRVERVGKNVTDFKPGDEVFGDIAEAGFGGFAEFVAAPARLLARKSPAMSFHQAAALPQAGLLALQGLRFKRTEIKPGEKILINGAGGGVGTIALQYAKSLGAEVTCVDKANKFKTLQNLGADHLIDYRQEDYTRKGQQYDMILDVIAHRKLSDYKHALKRGGTFAMIGGSMGWLLLQIMLFGSLISQVGDKKLGIMGYRPNRNDLDILRQLFEKGVVAPVIDRIYSLKNTKEAFEYFGTGDVKGKVVIEVASS